MLLLLAGVAVVVLALDQVTKALAVARLTPDVPVRVLGPVLSLRLIRNSGAAFSFATGATWVFTLIAIVVILVIARVARRLGSTGWAVALGLLLAGAAGNLTDRLARAPGVGRGHVIDFLQLPRWPIFNVADSSICAAAVLIAILALRGVEVEGRPAAPGAADGEGVPDDAQTIRDDAQTTRDSADRA